ncbi:histidine phosphatase family protein [Falsirhodobacter sp. alg1]|uniref:SixA phosphatase family protein n=1 Tax=Falsirhodobacter sp. alg1 TaxID=1472418 RepID=UPI0005EF7183
MPRLILIRHAKSGWDDPLLTDHQRPLAPRGIESCAAIAGWLEQQGIAPSEILCSDARRTRETSALVFPAITPTLIPDLYHASPDCMMRELRKATAGTVAMIGHNPGIGSFAQNILMRFPSHIRFADYPTAATLIADFGGDSWKDAGFAGAEPVAFTVPRDL